MGLLGSSAIRPTVEWSRSPASTVVRLAVRVGPELAHIRLGLHREVCTCTGKSETLRGCRIRPPEDSLLNAARCPIAPGIVGLCAGLPHGRRRRGLRLG